MTAIETRRLSLSADRHRILPDPHTVQESRQRPRPLTPRKPGKSLVVTEDGQLNARVTAGSVMITTASAVSIAGSSGFVCSASPPSI